MSASFRCLLRDFASFGENEILGQLIAEGAKHGFAVHYQSQTETWQFQLRFLGRLIETLLEQLPRAAGWTCLLEFEIPRRGKRPDVVLIADDILAVIEFKVGSQNFLTSAKWQVRSYCLDLHDFHQASAGRRVLPILVATAAAPAELSAAVKDDSLVGDVTCVGDGSGQATAAVILSLYRRWHSEMEPEIDAAAWEAAAYRPSPTIVEAAEQLFAGHQVTEISHALSSNLTATSAELLAAIDQSQKCGRRSICFVTGIPGAGKTLAGLNAVHDPAIRSHDRPSAVFLSGNGPLVKIVRAALVRDQQRRGVSAPQAKRTVATFIDNIHKFINEYGIRRPNEAPHENAVIYDEAQRAWNARAVLKAHEVERSEPELILDVMERAPGWCTVIALVGGGQEIHRGEGGLSEWGRALNRRNQQWYVLASQDALDGGHAVAGHRLFEESPAAHLTVVTIPSLHLSVSVRSPRACRMGEWVNALLEMRTSDANVADDLGRDFPVVLTRDLRKAREWLKERADGQQRCGLLASSGALRLRAEGIEVSSGFRSSYSYEDWFLSESSDTRSSGWLEVAATEFECQGLEVDWACICWGGDFVIGASADRWNCRRFRGTGWQSVRKADDIQYAKNKYRVLLTRARKGMIIYVPIGDVRDVTREPALFDATAEFLQNCGIPVLS